MAELINVYCDESCHLEHDRINVMGLGSIYVAKNRIKEINRRIIEIKARNGVKPEAEVKWTKVAPVKLQLYIDLVNYFFDDDDLHFRALIVPDKTRLDHSRFNQTHDEWYYKMYFEMLKAIWKPNCSYSVYIDIKDSNSSRRAQKLHDVCCNHMYDFSRMVIQKVQPIRSDEVQLMQIVDVLLGAVTYANRVFPEGFIKSSAKQEIVNLIRKRSMYALTKSTFLREEKLNLFIWEAR